MLCVFFLCPGFVPSLFLIFLPKSRLNKSVLMKNAFCFYIMLLCILIVSSPLKLGGGGKVLVLGIWTKRGVIKNCSEIGGELKGGSSQKEWDFQIVSSVFLQKSMFSLLLDFFRLVNIHTCYNQWIYSFMWFSFYQKMIYYEISFPLTLISSYNFVKISLFQWCLFPFPFH